MTIFDALRDSHTIQRALCRRLVRTRDAAMRQTLFLQLKVELEAHAAAEERYLYVPLLLTDGGLSASRHALSEHHEIEELCEQLSVRDKSSDDWAQTMATLSHQVHHHLREEESKFFQVGGRLLGDPQKTRLAGQYQRDVVRMRRKLAQHYQTVDVGADGMLQPARRKAAAPA